MKNSFNRKGRHCLQKNNAGFTLLETLVAMMVLAISLVTILQLFSGGLRSAKVSNDYTHAVFYARQKMDEFLLMDQLTEGELEGRFENEYGWKVSIKEFENSQLNQTGKNIRLFSINVVVSWGPEKKRKQFDIQTVQIAKKS